MRFPDSLGITETPSRDCFSAPRAETQTVFIRDAPDISTLMLLLPSRSPGEDATFLLILIALGALLRESLLLNLRLGLVGLLLGYPDKISPSHLSDLAFLAVEAPLSARRLTAPRDPVGGDGIDLESNLWVAQTVCD